MKIHVEKNVGNHNLTAEFYIKKAAKHRTDVSARKQSEAERARLRLRRKASTVLGVKPPRGNIHKVQQAMNNAFAKYIKLKTQYDQLVVYEAELAGVMRVLGGR